MAEPHDLVMREIATDHPFAQPVLKCLSDEATGPREVLLTARHEHTETRCLGRSIAHPSVLDANEGVGIRAGAFVEQFRLPHAVAPVASALLQDREASLTQPGAETLREFRRRAVEVDVARSEERRVGKECRSRWSPY